MSVEMDVSCFKISFLIFIQYFFLVLGKGRKEKYMGVEEVNQKMKGKENALFIHEVNSNASHSA